MQDESTPASTKSGWYRWQQRIAGPPWPCTMCRKVLPGSEFYRSVPSYCRDCHRQRQRDYNARVGPQRHHDFIRTLKGRFGRGRRYAREKGLEWALTREAFAGLLSRPCYYCAAPLPSTGHGLDRLDNSIGYIDSNVVPCCEVCNMVRRDTFTPDEMSLLGAVIAQIRQRRPGLFAFPRNAGIPKELPPAVGSGDPSTAHTRK